MQDPCQFFNNNKSDLCQKALCPIETDDQIKKKKKEHSRIVFKVCIAILEKEKSIGLRIFHNDVIQEVLNRFFKHSKKYSVYKCGDMQDVVLIQKSTS
jgi:hypothetical protein